MTTVLLDPATDRAAHAFVDTTEQAHNERNFGTDISTLIRLIESGEV